MQFRLHKIVKESVHQAFWDLLKEDLEKDPPEYTRALILLEEIKEVSKLNCHFFLLAKKKFKSSHTDLFQWLLSLLLPHQTKTQNEVREKIDIDLIRQQIEAGTLDMHVNS